jgi:hypothetical protein
MDDYHEFKHAHEIQIEECRLYWSPSYVSITRGIVAPSGATITLNNSISGNGSASGNGATERGGTTKGGIIGASISTQGPLLVFNPVVEFFSDELR